MLTSPQRRLLAEADIDRRRTEKQSAASGYDSDSKDLISKMRAGKLNNEQIGLLSYLGYEPAQQFIPTTPSRDLYEFALGLSEFGDDHMLIRAAVISAMVALPIWEAEYPDNDSPRKAVEAATAWRTADPNDLQDAARAAFDASNYNAVTKMAYYAAQAAAFAVYATIGNAEYAAIQAITNAGAAGDDKIREAIQQGLIKWVLNDQ